MRKYLNLDSPWGAANWMNHHKLGISQLKGLMLGNHPPHVLADVACLAYARQAPLIRALSRRSFSARELFRRMTETFAVRHGDMKVAVDRMIDSHMLESSSDGVVTAIRGGFSYGDTHEDLLTYAECPACGASSEGEFDDETAIHAAFDHVQGPYHRCNNCEELVRPEVYEEMGYPSCSSYDGEHDQYIQDLDNCLALMAAEAAIPVPVPFDHVHVTSSRADWTGRSGAAVITATPDALADLLSVRGEYTISDGKLVCRQGQFPYMSCVMSHHDVPTGSSITITPVWECEVSSGGELIPPEDTANAAKRAEAVRTLFAGLHPSLTGYKYQMCSAEGWVEAVEEFVVSLEDFFEGHHPIITLIEGADPLNLEAIKALRELLDIVRESSINA